MKPRLLAPIVLLVACTGGEDTLRGQVVDIWGAPVPEATVVLEGHPTQYTTDPNGNFSLPQLQGKQKIKAGRDGYIQEHLEIDLTEGADTATPLLRLYPRPEETGFYVVGKGEYIRLEPQKVYTIGNDLAAITGIKAVETRAESDPFEVVYETDLRMDEIMRLGLELHQLQYEKTAELAGPLQKEEVKVNLWVSKGEIAMSVDPMRSRNVYRITSEDSLEPGWYGFTTQDLLDPKEPGALDSVPENLRVAFAFELR